ncbi:copper resistance CopC/CopD family protein [Alkalihalobacillus sp. BA299]|uniref:copper resistance CopC/CopD family protein n=1 Tax=Alkalihalobacillus sp. BA299 TaxID=2815938 RepID=UPI001ADAB791|nr:copper resistance protein CopC [Alkalihalobacillus sp. BA299]
MIKNKGVFLGLIFSLFVVVLFVNQLEGQAHSKIETVNPSISEIVEYSPDQIEVTFADPVEIYSDSIRVIASNGATVQTPKPAIDSMNKRKVVLSLEEPLSAGRYTVEIHAIAMDGHEIKERYQFEIEKDKIPESEFWRNLQLTKSIPADGEVVSVSPNQIELWFSDDIELEVVGLFDDNQKMIQVVDYTGGHQGPRQHFTIELDSELPKGTYEVNWYVKKDNKSKNGTFYFAVEEVTSVIPPEGQKVKMIVLSNIGLNEIASWLSYIGVFILFGGMFFQLFIARGSGCTNKWKKAKLVLYLISLVGFLLLVTTQIFEFPNISLGEFLKFQFVWGILIQIALVMIAFVLMSTKAPFILLYGVIFMWALSGHAVSERYGGILSIILDAIHLFSIAIWLGGLVTLLLMIPKDNGLTWLKEKGKIFSKYALISMGVMLLSGLAMLYRYLPSFSLESLTISSWGQFLLIKIVLFIAIILLGMLQIRLIKKDLQNRAKVFRTQLKTELFLGIIIIFFAASLVNASPRTAEQGVYPVNSDQAMNVSVEISPFKPGYNDLVMEFQNPNEIKAVDVELFMPPIMKRTLTAFPVEDGRFKVTGSLLHGSGAIYLTIHVKKVDGEKITIPYEIQVPGEMY